MENSALIMCVISTAVLFTAFYIFFSCGIVVGSIMIILAVILSCVISWTLVRCASHFEAEILEEIALKAYGPALSKFTSVCLICTQMGFMVLNTILVKTILPYSLE